MAVIVHVIEATATGTLSMVCLLANEFSSRGHEVHVVYSLRPETPKRIDALFSDSVNLHEVQMSGRRIISGWLRLSVLLRTIKPDVIHMHSSFAGFIARFAVYFGSTKWIYSPHCISFMRKDIGSLKKRVFVALEHIASARKTLYAACSVSEKKEISAAMNVEVAVVENALRARSQDEWTLPQSKSKNAKCKVVAVGGIRVQKNPQQYADIAAWCEKNAPGSYEFHWLGDGDEEYKSKLKKSNVRVSGWMSREDVSVFVSDCDIFLSTSLWEGMPVSVLEAMEAGVIVVVSRCAGNVDIVRNGENGYLYKSEADAFKTLEFIRNNENSTLAIIEKARIEVSDRYSVKRFVKQFEELYEMR